jgi:ADP-ribose pyrophosphatase YjhB (NUDIX family)
VVVFQYYCKMASSLHHASNFVISCGTVTLDLQQSKALLIRWQNPGGGIELMLPKGRKNIGETLEGAALRETEEETGYAASLLPLPVPTLATSDGTSKQDNLTTEPVSVTERYRGDVWKIIFWFAAQADSTSRPQRGVVQESEDFETVWEHLSSVAELVTHDADRKVLMEVLRLVELLA